MTECENAFRELKGKLIDKPVLYVPNFEREFIVQTDASNADLKNIIIGSKDYEEEFVRAQLSVISEERVERETEENRQAARNPAAALGIRIE
ncbi:hypothetical protein TNCV_3446391 [Trichonephila clavipes]|nr:hypothetical protein TNCV_3446391 [Trichonephila clavipes]